MSFIKEVFGSFADMIIFIVSILILIIVWASAILGWIPVILVAVLYGVQWGLLAFIAWLFAMALFGTLAGKCFK